MFFSKSTGVAAIEGELSKLESRRSALQHKLTAANASLEQARMDRRESFISGDSEDTKTLARSDSRLSECEREFAAIQDALVEIDPTLLTPATGSTRPATAKHVRRLRASVRTRPTPSRKRRCD